MAFMEGTSDPYVEGFAFEVPEDGTADPVELSMEELRPAVKIDTH